MVAATAVVLLCAAGLLIANTVHEERERMFVAMKSRADGVIWALEGATRSLFMMHRASSPIQKLVEEIARQPNIDYLAVVGPDGRILVHNDPAKVGRFVADPGALTSFADAAESRGMYVTVDGNSIYEVVKPFTPSISLGRHGRHGMRQRWAQEFPDFSAQEFYVVVGIDPAVFRQIYTDRVFTTTVVAGLVALCGITGLALFFMFRNYRASKRMLRDARALTLQVFENLPIGVFTTDNDGTMTLYNRHIAETFGIRQGKEPPRLADYPLFDWQSVMREARSGRTTTEREVTLGLPGEPGVPASLSVSPITGGDGMAMGCLFIVRDLAEVKKLQRQIRLNERLSALGNLAAGVAHEVRNPLSSIKGYATFLAGKFAEGEPAHRTGQMMIKEVERLNRVVSDLLNVARMGVVDPKPQTIRPVLEHALRLAEPDAASRKVRLEAPEESELFDCVLPLDADRLVQALLNLLLNAVQATDEGGSVRLDLARGTGPEGDARLVVNVRDTGCGMTEATLAGLFTPYFTTKASGTGLGLTIVHQIVEQHGGSITVNSRVGQGSVFSISLPVRLIEPDGVQGVTPLPGLGAEPQNLKETLIKGLFAP